MLSLAGILAGGCSPKLLRTLPVLTAAATSVSDSGGGGGGSSPSLTISAAGLRGLQAATGDFDQDGDVDVVFVSQTTDAVLYAAGDGSGGFAAVVSYAMAQTPVGVTAGDLDRDGDLYLFVTSDTSNVYYIPGNGDGTFGAASSNFAWSANIGITMGNFDTDGDLDAVVTLIGSDQVAPLMGSFGGTLTFGATYAVGDMPTGIASGVLDLNGTANDGKLSIVVANSGANTISVLLGNGNGTFNAAVSYAMGTTPVGVALGDFNKDGALDVVTANSGSSNISIRTGVGDGTFGAETTYTVGTNPVGVVVADFNRDGDLDIAVTNNGSDNISVLLGAAGATFGAATNTATSDGPMAIVAADFNRNGEPDAVAIESTDNVPTLVSGTDPADPATVTQASTIPGSTQCDAALGDIDHDGDIDIVYSNLGSGTVGVYDNNGSGAFALVENLNVGSGAGSQPCGIELTDFTRDGWLDFVVTLRTDGTVQTFTNDRDGTFTLADTQNFLAGAGTPWDVEVGDMDKDGDPDVVVIGIETGDANSAVEVFFNNSAAVLSTYDSVIDGPNDTWRGSLADLDNDGNLDISVATRTVADLTAALNDGSGGFPVAFTTVLNEAVGNDIIDVITADINRDGWLDFFIANTATAGAQDRELQYVRGDGTGALGSFLAPLNYDVTGADGNATAVLSGDFDWDGDLDVAIALTRDASVEVMTSDLTTGFTGFTTTDTEINCTDSGWGDVADLNGDGALDFALTCSTDNTVGIYLSD